MSFQMPGNGGAAGREPGPPAGAGRRGRTRALLPTVVIVVVLLGLFSIFTGYYTDLLWFRSVNFSSVFSRQLLTKALLFVFFGLALGGALAANFVIAFRSRPLYAPASPEQANLDRYRTGIEPFRRLLVLGAAGLIGLFAGSSAASEWRTYLLWRNRTSFGIVAPQLGHDVSFYAMSLPWWRFVLGFAFATVVLCLLAALLTHYLYGGVRLQAGGDRTTRAARGHLSVLLGIFVLLKAIAYYLDRFSLIVKDGDIGATGFTGLTYTDINAVLPAKAILAVIALICSLLFFVNVLRRGWLLPGIGVGLLVLCAVLIGALYPAFIQYFKVRPSEADREATNISRNIEATRQAYGIKDAEIMDYAADVPVTSGGLRDAGATIPNVRLVDPAVVSPAFKQLQQIRGFYGFPDTLDIDRYTIAGKKQDVVVAVRELDLAGQTQRNWINDHVVYTHGFGFVGALGNTRDADGRPTFVESNIPPTGGLGDFQPRIYFGEKSPDYSIVGAPAGAAPRELDFLDEKSASGQRNFAYDGAGGVPVGSMFRKALFAMKFQEGKILLSNLVNDSSRMLYVREPRDRVEKVAPWLHLDGDAYPALVDGKVTWILDGYTTVDGFPYSRRLAFGDATQDTITETRGAVARQSREKINYIRNSVKATVDAYDGTVHLYTWDESDPVLATWKKAFPGTVQDKGEISPSLMEHLRYPEDLFKVQRELIAQYHVDDPSSFYGGQDFWRVPRDPTAPRSSNTDQPPYYLTLKMPSQAAASFSLTSAFRPNTGDKDNLTAFMAVDATPGEGYGKLRILRLPSNTTLAGPGQVQNEFESSPKVSATLTLLRNGGSDVEFGNLLTLPVGGGFLYVEPVYVRAASGSASYPLLQKVLVRFGDKIGFADTLQQALDETFQGDSGTNSGEGQTPPPSGGGGGNSALTKALAQADQAYRDSQDALKAGDFTKYGQAQERLRVAIVAAVAAAKTTQGSGTPTPVPSGSTTPLGSPSAQPSAPPSG